MSFSLATQAAFYYNYVWYKNIKISQLEKKENHELLRCIENGLNIYGLEIPNYGSSVDTNSDLLEVRKLITKNSIYKKYCI